MDEEKWHWYRLFWLRLRHASFPSQWSVPSPMEVRGPNLWTTREFPRWFFCEAFDTAGNDFVNSFGNVMAFERLFPSGSDSKESACSAEDLGSIPGSGRSLEKGMTTHSSILAWRIPWTEEPGGLQSMELQRVRHNWVTFTSDKVKSKVLLS